MSKKLNWAINIALFVLILGVLFNGWVDLVFGFVVILAYFTFFIVQLIRHRGGDERSRYLWRSSPRWWLRFARDDFEESKEKKVSPRSPSPKR